MAVGSLQEWARRFLLSTLGIDFINKFDKLFKDFSNIFVCFGGAFKEFRSVLVCKSLTLLFSDSTLTWTVKIELIAGNDDGDF